MVRAEGARREKNWGFHYVILVFFGKKPFLKTLKIKKPGFENYPNPPPSDPAGFREKFRKHRRAPRQKGKNKKNGRAAGAPQRKNGKMARAEGARPKNEEI